ncbi:MAG: chromo domain-containing protein, partial [Pyrinomonadaceae bacterium]|nr:chromo domain-containing protein [Pyrinomonadaceae bacterium]
FVMHTYIMTVHASSRQTPFFLTHGREATLPVDVMLDRLRERPMVPIADYVENVKRQLSEGTEFARKSLERAHNTQKQQFDKRRSEKSFSVNDKVLVYSPYIPEGMSPKFVHPWRGPFVVTKVLSDVNYQVALMERPDKVDVVHVEKMKLYPVEDRVITTRAKRRRAQEIFDASLQRGDDGHAPVMENIRNSDESKGKDKVVTRRNEPNTVEPANDLTPGDVSDSEDDAAVDDELEYEVEKVIGHRTHKGVTQYRVKWRHFPVSQATWEPEDALANAQEALDRYLERPMTKRQAAGKRRAQ